MDRTRFLVTGLQRSGTTLLVCLLDSHPQIQCYGGVFNRRSSKALDPHAESSIPMIERIFTSEERLDIPRRRYQRDPDGVRAVGFKTHPDHWDDSLCRKHVVAASEIKVLHLRRRNILRLLVSGMNARRSGTWNSINTEDATRCGIVVTREQLAKMDSHCHRISEEIARDFTDHEILEVCYEDLEANATEVLALVQRFLGVRAVADLSTDTVKLGAINLEDAVANYDELRREVAGTPLERHFS